jgi:hypothetical protein|tara:strand:+ start:197 stop:439 length:243 start_codon:yes stop_codon:yes gene_type:complete
MTQFETGQLVRAEVTLHKGTDGTVKQGDIGLIAELMHKDPRHPDHSGPWQSYRVKWLTKAAFGVWWVMPEHLVPANWSER